ncbi:MAG: hypothetical protein VW736_08750, partial [Alphaproteobacteria bacterium]
ALRPSIPDPDEVGSTCFSSADCMNSDITLLIAALIASMGFLADFIRNTLQTGRLTTPLLTK